MSCGGGCVKEQYVEKTPARSKCACIKNIDEIKKLLKRVPNEPPCQNQNSPPTPPTSPMSQCIYDNVSLKSNTHEESYYDKIFKEQYQKLFGSSAPRAQESKEPPTHHHHKQPAQSAREPVSGGHMHRQPAKIEQKESCAYGCNQDKPYRGFTAGEKYTHDKPSCGSTAGEKYTHDKPFSAPSAGENKPKAGCGVSCALNCEQLFMEKYRALLFNPNFSSDKPTSHPVEPKPPCIKPTQRVEQFGANKLQQDSELDKDFNKEDKRTLTKLLVGTVQMVQMLLTFIALLIYYIIFTYMNLIYFTLKSAIYFQQADAAMKTTIAVVTVTSLVIAINLLTKLERLTGIYV